jgi:hypothetical protein
VDVVVVSAPTFQPTVASTYLTAVMGRAPTYDRGAWVWYGLGSAPARPLTSQLLQWCTTLTRRPSDRLTGPHCVLALSSS